MTACVTAATRSPRCRSPISCTASTIRFCPSVSRSPFGQTASPGRDRYSSNAAGSYIAASSEVMPSHTP